MKERPILFSGPMVRAILAGQKTQTRRIVKGEALRWLDENGFVPSFVADPGNAALSPYGAPGDRLWVKETHAFFSIDAFKYLEGPLASLGLRAYGGAPLTPGCHLRWHSGDAMVHYAAHPTSPRELEFSPGFATWRSMTPDKWRPSIFMPRWASRITLDVTAVRVERLWSITDADALAEGVFDEEAGWHKEKFRSLWTDINGIESWPSNPWVWVVEFRRVEAQDRAA